MLFAVCYAIGGRKYKWFRRYVGPAVFVSGILGLAFLLGRFNPYLLIPSCLLFIVYTLGYGGTGAKKVIRRSIYALALATVGLVFGIVLGQVGLGIIQFILTLCSVIYLGLWNPILAVNEEGLIATLSIITIPFMV